MSALASDGPARERREALKEVLARTRACVRCPELASTRRSVVFGAGNADAELMFIGEAPGASEDEQGLPFVGRAGKLLQTLLGEIGLQREDVFIANVLKCHPPQNRDPQPAEIANCQEYLFRQVELIQPAVICTLGNFATKLLRADPAGITRVHGQPEVITLGSRAVRLYPIYHPAAALYTPRMLETLREDFARLPDLLELGPPQQPQTPEIAQEAAQTPESAQEAAQTPERAEASTQTPGIPQAAAQTPGIAEAAGIGGDARGEGAAKEGGRLRARAARESADGSAEGSRGRDPAPKDGQLGLF